MPHSANTGGNRATLSEREIFPSSNVWGIPDLLPELIAGLDQFPNRTVLGENSPAAGGLLGFGTASRQQDLESAVLHFFVDDYRFEFLWNKPRFGAEFLVGRKFAAVCEPDFSMWSDAPLALQMYQVFRARWLSRLWQSFGIQIVPSLNWSAPESHSWCFAGIPFGVPWVIVEARPRGKDRRLFLRGLNAGIERIQPKRVLLYGGEISPDLPSGPEYVSLPAWSPRRRRAA